MLKGKIKYETNWLYIYIKRTLNTTTHKVSCHVNITPTFRRCPTICYAWSITIWLMLLEICQNVLRDNYVKMCLEICQGAYR